MDEISVAVTVICASVVAVWFVRSRLLNSHQDHTDPTPTPSNIPSPTPTHLPLTIARHHAPLWGGIPSTGCTKAILFDWDRTLCPVHMWSEYGKEGSDDLLVSSKVWEELSALLVLANKLHIAVAIVSYGSIDAIEGQLRLAEAFGCPFIGLEPVGVFTPVALGQPDGYDMGDNKESLIKFALGTMCPSADSPAFILIDDSASNVATARQMANGIGIHAQSPVSDEDVAELCNLLLHQLEEKDAKGYRKSS